MSFVTDLTSLLHRLGDRAPLESEAVVRQWHATVDSLAPQLVALIAKAVEDILAAKTAPVQPAVAAVEAAASDV